MQDMIVIDFFSFFVILSWKSLVNLNEYTVTFVAVRLCSFWVSNQPSVCDMGRKKDKLNHCIKLFKRNKYFNTGGLLSSVYE